MRQASTRRIPLRVVPLVAFAIVWLGAAQSARGQTDEIQVYDATLTPPGKFNLTLHNNFTPRGLREPSFPGALVSDKSFNGVPEWAYGVTDWFEAGLYLPVYSIGKVGTAREATLDSAKLRALFASPHAQDRRFFYGANFEFSFNARHWSPRRFTSEVRPIVGWHLGRVDVIFNPILDTEYTGLRNVEFVPATRVAYSLSRTWAIAAEEYSTFGTLHHFYRLNDQGHQLWGVFDHQSKIVDIEAGVGFGLTSASDKLTLKFMLSRDL